MTPNPTPQETSMVDKRTGLPVAIESDGVAYRLNYKYFGGLDDFWTLAYESFRDWPNKKVFLQREELSLEKCVSGAKRDLKHNPNLEMLEVMS